MTHLDYLIELIPTLPNADLLDIGAGKGTFLINAARKGIRARGIELNQAYIATAHERARAEGVSLNLVEGIGERLPFEDGVSGFANLSEVIEHVEDPAAVLDEVHRVLHEGGNAYVSVPMRYSLRDPHYKLYFVNWLPRSIGSPIASVLRWRRPVHCGAGAQTLAQMHYFTYGAFARLARRHGFRVEDIRECRIRARIWPAFVPFVLAAYRLLRPWCFDAVHLLLTKEAFSYDT